MRNIFTRKRSILGCYSSCKYTETEVRECTENKNNSIEMSSYRFHFLSFADRQESLEPLKSCENCLRDHPPSALHTGKRAVFFSSGNPKQQQTLDKTR